MKKGGLKPKIEEKKNNNNTVPTNNVKENYDKIYVSNQFNPVRINDFISKVNSQNWGIHIEKTED